MRKVYCPYCGKRAELVNSEDVYGRDYGHRIYICWPCNAYVGCHKDTDRPLGRLANAELRSMKIQAHAAFDPLWQSGQMKRKAAYAWLAEQMNRPVKQTHIGYFDVTECREVIRIVDKFRKDEKNAGKEV